MARKKEPEVVIDCFGFIPKKSHCRVLKDVKTPEYCAKCRFRKKKETDVRKD